VPIVSLPLEAIFVNTLAQKSLKVAKSGITVSFAPASLVDGESRLPYSTEAAYNIKKRKG